MFNICNAVLSYKQVANITVEGTNSAIGILSTINKHEICFVNNLAK